MNRRDFIKGAAAVVAVGPVIPAIPVTEAIENIPSSLGGKYLTSFDGVNWIPADWLLSVDDITS